MNDFPRAHTYPHGALASRSYLYIRLLTGREGVAPLGYVVREPSVALECGSDQPRARLTAGPDVREHPCQPRWASFLKVSCGKTAVKTRAFRSEIIIMSVTVDSSRDEASLSA